MTADASFAPPVRAVSDYGVLMAQVKRAHLLDRSVLTYAPRFIAIGLMMLFGAVAFLWIGHSWWQLGVAAYFAVVFSHLGFLGHDAGHQQIFRKKSSNDWLGLVVSNLGVGLSYAWWVDKHHRHHSHPNEVGRDPDVARNVLAWTPEQADCQRGAIRFIAKRQAALFFPLLFLEAFNLHVGSVRVLMRDPRGRVLEIGLLAAHVAGCVTVLLLVVSPIQALAFVAVQQCLFGLYLGCSFAPNHKGMPITTGPGAHDFLRRQVLTSRNVTGGRMVALALGSLNYQIEHHLFPSMPSRNLRRCQPMVKRYCSDQGVPYCETSLLGSYSRVLRYLHSIQPSEA